MQARLEIMLHLHMLELEVGVMWADNLTRPGHRSTALQGYLLHVVPAIAFHTRPGRHCMEYLLQVSRAVLLFGE